MTSNPRIVFAKLPGDGLPAPGEHIVLDTSRTIDLEAVPLNGGFLTKTLILKYVSLFTSSRRCVTYIVYSPEPAMRERMRDASIPSYTTSYVLGAP